MKASFAGGGPVGGPPLGGKACGGELLAMTIWEKKWSSAKRREGAKNKGSDGEEAGSHSLGASFGMCTRRMEAHWGHGGHHSPIPQ